MRIKLTSEFEPFFMKEALNHSPTKKDFMTKAKTGTMTTIGQDDIASSVITFPSIKEQARIGTFFQTLDRTITFHQREPIANIVSLKLKVNALSSRHLDFQALE